MFMGVTMLMGAVMTVACSSNEDPDTTDAGRVQAGFNFSIANVDEANAGTRAATQTETIKLKPLEGYGPTLVVTVAKGEQNMATRAYDFDALQKTVKVWDWLEKKGGTVLQTPAMFTGNGGISLRPEERTGTSGSTNVYDLSYSHYIPNEGDTAKVFGYISLMPEGCTVNVTEPATPATNKQTIFKVTMPESGYVTAAQEAGKAFGFVCFGASNKNTNLTSGQTAKDEPTGILGCTPFYTFNFNLTPSTTITAAWGNVQKIKISNCYKSATCEFTDFEPKFTTVIWKINKMKLTYSDPPAVVEMPLTPSATGKATASMSVLRKTLKTGTLKLVFSKANGQGKFPTVTYDLSKVNNNFGSVSILNFTLSNQ